MQRRDRSRPELLARVRVEQVDLVERRGSTGAFGGVESLGGFDEGWRSPVGGVGEVDDDVRFVERASAVRAHRLAAARISGSRRPGVSKMTICASSVVWMPTMRSRVDCGLGLVMRASGR